MLNSFPVYIGLRYATAKRGGMLVAFLSRISVAGLVLGVGLLITVLSVMNGFEKELQDRILNLVPHSSILHYESIDDWKAVNTIVAGHPEVEASAPFIHVNGLLSTAGKVEAVLLHCVLPEEEARLSTLGEYITEGSLDSIDAATRGIAIGDLLAKKLKLKMGDRLRLIVPAANSQLSATPMPRIRDFKLQAIFHTGTEIDHSLAVVHLSHGQDLLGYTHEVQGIRVQMKDVFQAPQVSWELIQNLPQGYYARDWQRTHGNLYEAIQLSRSLVTLMIFMVITVAVFNVISSLVMVVTDKNEDIAILKTMGASGSDILKIFVFHGVVIGLIGTLLGVLLGVALTLSLPTLIQLLERGLDYQFLNSAVYPVDYLPTDLRMDDVGVVALVAVLMSVAATVYPAWRASKVEPANALRWH